MVKRILVVLVIAVAIIGSASQSLSAQSTPPRPLRDLDTGQLPIERVPVGADRDEPRVSAQAAPLQATGIAEWSKLAYQSYIGNWDIFAANGDGTDATRLTSSGAPDITPRFNRGATRIAYASSEPGNYEIYTINPNGSGKTRVTNNGANDYNPAWSPDGSKIVFNSYRDGQSEIYVMNAAGSNQVRLTTDAGYDGQPVWSPDSTRIAFLSDRSGGSRIWMMNANGSGATQLTAQPYSEDPAWSPDGTQIAYDADADGDGWQELMIVNADGTNPHVIGDTNTTADMWARSWSPDGRSIAFTAIYYVYYQGNWYWTSAYLRAMDTTTYGIFSLGGSNTDWMPDWQTTDVLPPTSSVTALPATSPSPITVKWSGADAGPAGILGFDVQVKDGTGAWMTWLTHTVQTSAGYPGIGGRTYSFRVRAVDNSSNVQAWPANAQASTTVEALPPISSINALPAYYRGELPVSWGGSDPGNSGIAVYDVQYRDGAAGAWIGWQIGTSTTSAPFTGVPGHTYYFRVRATDRAQNVENWRPGEGNTSTVFYDWQVSGSVFDGRHKPVADASLHIVPAAVNATTSGANGQYVGLTSSSGHHSLSVTQTGYSQIAAMSLDISQDVTIDHILPPFDDQIKNGGFENGPDLTNWIAGGVITPTVAGTKQHTGQRSAYFGAPPVLPTTIQAGYPGSRPDVVSDANGNLYAVWNTMNYYDIVYVTKPHGGTWSTPIKISGDTGDASTWPAMAIDITGTLHVIWTTGQQVFYSQKPQNEGWSIPTVAVETYGFEPDMVVDHQGALHVLACGNDTVWYVSKSTSGNWSAPIVIGSGREPALAITSDDSLHAVWHMVADPPTSSQIMYSNKPLSMAWSVPVELSNSQLSRAPKIAVDSSNTAHATWMDSAKGVAYSRKAPGADWTTPESVVTGMLSPFIAVSGANTVHLAYHRQDSNFELDRVYYMVNDGTGWSASVQLSNSEALVPVIVIDPQSQAHVLWISSQGLYYYGPIPKIQADDMFLSQSVTVPNIQQKPTLSFLYQLNGASAANGSWLEVQIDNGLTTRTPITISTNTDVWTHRWLDMSDWAGQIVTLTFNLRKPAGVSVPQAYLDEISLGSWLTPDPQAVTPSHIILPATQIITVTGDNFIATPQVRLNDVSLSDVTWINTTTLTATVPVLSLGRYDLIVTNPGGQASGLPRAVLVGYEVMLPILRK